MNSKEMIKIIKAINKRKAIERRFKSNEYTYVWEDSTDIHPNFNKYDYRIKDVNSESKIRVARLLYSNGKRNYFYYAIIDNEDLATIIECQLEFNGWMGNWIEGDDILTFPDPTIIDFRKNSESLPNKVDLRFYLDKK